MNKTNFTLLVTMVVIATLFLFGTTNVSAQPVLKQNVNGTLNIPCVIDGNGCSPSAWCNVTVLNPEQTILFNNAPMNQNGSTYSIDLSASQVSLNGEYPLTVMCCDGGECGNRNLVFFVTPNGELATTGKGILYIGILAVLFIFFVLCIWGGIQANHVALKSFLWLFGYVLFIGIAFIAWNLSIDYLTSSPFLIVIFKWVFYFFLVAFFPVLLFAVIYSLYMMTKIREIQNMIDRGMPQDEAYERTVRKGFGGSKKW